MILWQSLLIGWAVMAILMAGLWLIQTRTHNAGIVDIAWSFGTGLMGGGFGPLVILLPEELGQAATAARSRETSHQPSRDSQPFRFDSSHHPPLQVAPPLRVLLGELSEWSVRSVPCPLRRLDRDGWTERASVGCGHVCDPYGPRSTANLSIWGRWPGLGGRLW